VGRPVITSRRRQILPGRAEIAGPHFAQMRLRPVNQGIYAGLIWPGGKFCRCKNRLLAG
jgi:hypothetical protein